MPSRSPFGDIALKARVADLSNRLAEAEAALQAASADQQSASEADSGLKEELYGAKATLALERNLLRTLIDIFPDHIYVRDRAGRHLLNNRTQLALLGAATLEETLGKTDFDFYPPDAAKRYFEMARRQMEDGEPMIDQEELVPGAHGEKVWLSTTRVPLRDSDGTVIGLLGIARDITERKQALQKITEQATMLDQAHDIILMLDLEGRVLYWNKAAEHAVGWTAAEAAGKTVADLYPPEDWETLRAAAAETLSKGVWNGELRLHDKHKREVYIQTHRSLIRDADGNPKAQLSIGSDITDQKKSAGQALRNQRLESLGTLAGGIAHDLNNVLAPILMAIALLKLKVPDESGQRLLGMLEQNAERGAQLVRQVLAFGRGAEGARMLIQPLHIAREIQEIVGDTFPKSIGFELKSGPEPWTVTGDPTQLHQVLLNLCVNARDAMEDGGKITVTLENLLLDETYAGMNPGAKPGPYVVISVSDTGTGIPEHIRDRIFEPFFTTKDIGRGTGLGLSTSLGIVQNHGGFINVSSNVGRGSTFKIHLPASTEPAAPSGAAAKNPGLPRGHNELILLVDDEAPILNVAKTTLERFGYRAIVAVNGAEAVSIYALQREAIAAVVTDMAMPIMDGPAMAVALRAINPHVKIIGSSGMGASGGASVATNAGVTEFIAKPYNAETLLRALARVIGTKADGPDPRRPKESPNRPWA